MNVKYTLIGTFIKMIFASPPYDKDASCRVSSCDCQPRLRFVIWLMKMMDQGNLIVSRFGAIDDDI
jgi:hypothetical protein